MCMVGPGCSGSKSSSKGSSYTPKKMGGSGKASKGSYTPRTGRATLGGFGKPAVIMSFSGRR